MRTALARLITAVLAPMPRAMERIATRVKKGAFKRRRRAYRTFSRSWSMM
jgi:hypothetical protein